MGAFVAFQKLFNTTLSNTSALGPQIDSMIEAASQVNNTGIEVKNQLLSLLIINCLPKLYQQLAGTILFTAADVKKLTPAEIKPKIIKKEQRRVATRTQISKISKGPHLNKYCEKCGKKTNHTNEQHWNKGNPKRNGKNNSGNNGDNGRITRKREKERTKPRPRP